jgi:hypothetical protein
VRTFDDVLDDLERDGFGHWLAGFFDGEGCFVIWTARGRGTVSYACRAQIKLRDDDAAILHEVQRRTGVGRVIAEKVYGKANRDTKNTNPQMVWLAANKADCARVVRLFDRFPLRAKKRADFDLWRLAVREWQTKDRYGQWNRMAAFRRQLIESRRYMAEETTSPETAAPTPNVLPLFGEAG